MEKVGTTDERACMTDVDIILMENLVLAQLHDITEMKSSYMEAFNNGPTDELRKHFIRHQDSMEINAVQVQENSMFARPQMFQTANQYDPGSVIECTKDCRSISAEAALTKLIDASYERLPKSESADEPDKSSKSESGDKPQDKPDDKPGQQ